MSVNSSVFVWMKAGTRRISGLHYSSDQLSGTYCILYHNFPANTMQIHNLGTVWLILITSIYICTTSLRPGNWVVCLQVCIPLLMYNQCVCEIVYIYICFRQLFLCVIPASVFNVFNLTKLLMWQSWCDQRKNSVSLLRLQRTIKYFELNWKPRGSSSSVNDHRPSATKLAITVILRYCAAFIQ